MALERQPALTTNKAQGAPSDDDMSSIGSSTSACRSCATARRLRARMGFCSAAGPAARRASAAACARLLATSAGCHELCNLLVGCAGDSFVASSTSLSSLKLICRQHMVSLAKLRRNSSTLARPAHVATHSHHFSRFGKALRDVVLPTLAGLLARGYGSPDVIVICIRVSY